MQGLRAEDNIDIRCTGDNRVAFLAGNAAANANDQIGVLLFKVFDAAQIMENFFLCPLADRAGIEQDDVGFLGVVGLDDAFCGIEHVGHLVRIVLVHLAPESADEELLGHKIFFRIMGAAQLRPVSGKVGIITELKSVDRFKKCIL